MKERKRIPVQLPPGTLAGKPGIIVGPGQTLSLTAEIPASPYPVRRHLRVVGEADIFWRWRCEHGMPLTIYRSVIDALDPDDGFAETYSLKLSGRGETWPRNAYIKILTREQGPGLPTGAGTECSFAVMAKTDGLAIEDGGEVCAELGIYLASPDRHPDSVFDMPDQVIRLQIPPGTSDWREISTTLTIPKDAVAFLVRVGACKFSGTVRFGTPRLFSAELESVIPPFRPENVNWTRANWLGENLSRKEWPEFRICVDGTPVFEGQVYSSIVRAPDFEIPLPDMPAGEHSIDLQLVSDYPSAPHFRVFSVEVLEESTREVEVIGYPEYVPENSEFSVLLEHNSGADSRLEVRMMKAGEAGTTVQLEMDGQQYGLTRMVRKDDDGILLSTGDAIYVRQDPEAFRRYLDWYIENQVGNAMCLRPVYRWSGSRELNEDAWRFITPLLEKLGIKYYLMVDGRELPGKAANPPDALIAGPSYLGRQSHENDGAFCYWGTRLYDALFTDIRHRAAADGTSSQSLRPAVYKRDQVIVHFDPLRTGDMKEAAEYFIANMAANRCGSTRHTGPSTLFRYIYQAGYEWQGAEQMYGPEEVVLAALRGATRAAGKTSFGAHLATQWSSSPQDEQAHADRYFLSLATCYLQGVDEINTEEGLWRMECWWVMHDRFSHACQIHLEAHNRFRRFLQTHSRRGTMRTRIGVLQGRYCGWICIDLPGWSNVWGVERDEFRLGPPEESMTLLNVFYPRSVFKAIYRHPCAHEPQGWYTGTPYGPIDILPVESPEEMLRQYDALIFLGWNTFTEDDFSRLVAYVEAGGTLLLARPHLSTNTARYQPSRLPACDSVRRLLGDEADAPGPVVRKTVGKGRVIYFPADLYPSESTIRADYESEMRQLGDRAVERERERGWIRGSEDVNFTVYDHGHLRTIYLLNIRWWDRADARVSLLFGEQEHSITVPFGGIEVITISENWALMPMEQDAEVLDIRESGSGATATVQSDAGARLTVFSRSGSDRRSVTVDQGGVAEVTIR